MVIRLPLNNPAARLAFIFVGLPALALLVWLTIAHFIIGTVADTRAETAPALLVAAADYFPDAPQLQARLAVLELAETVNPEDAAARAETHAARAVRLSAKDYQNWLLLAAAMEARGETTGALSALRTAVQLAPRYTEVHWQLANLLLRSGQVAESLPSFRMAVSLDQSKLSPTLDLLFSVTDGNVGSLETAAGDCPNERLGLARFLLERSLTDDAVRVFRSVNRQAQLKSAETGQFISGLMAAGRYELARKLWGELVSPDGQSSLIWNGGFESDAISGLGQFDWALKDSEFAWIGISGGEGHSGARALRIDFAGRDTTRLSDEIRQMVIVQPGAEYRLECYVKTVGLDSPEGPRIQVSGSKGELAASEPVANGDRDWSLLTLNFKAPADSPVVFVGIRRTPKFSYDKPTSGSVWFDDFKLTPSEPAGSAQARR
ncbi:MAG: tetratricopeptide repeat protein [Blastocatellia bacterium]